MLRIGWVGPRELIALQREMPAARLAHFEKPADPKQLWTAQSIEGLTAFDHPRGFDVADFDGDGLQDFVVGESNGVDRLVVFLNQGGACFKSHVIATGIAAEQVHAVDWSANGRPGIVTIGKGVISLWKNQTPRPGTQP
jgi:hypothetical protein